MFKTALKNSTFSIAIALIVLGGLSMLSKPALDAPLPTTADAQQLLTQTHDKYGDLKPGLYGIVQITNYSTGSSRGTWIYYYAFGTMAECRAALPAFIQSEVASWNRGGQQNAIPSSSTQFAVRWLDYYGPAVFTHSCGQMNLEGRLVEDADYRLPDAPDWSSLQ